MPEPPAIPTISFESRKSSKYIFPCGPDAEMRLPIFHFSKSSADKKPSSLILIVSS
ncbi:hypothetical protein ES703_71910 [subsurface metagenome]